MASVPPVAVAVLAAGQSRRFGSADKLAAELRGTMLGLHACRTLAPLPFAQRWVIAASENHLCADGWRESGFSIVPNPLAESGMGSSVAQAAQLAEEAGAAALLIALADMPLVPAAFFADLLEQAAPSALFAAHNGNAPTPPALLGSDHFGQLMQASGDQGARTLLAAARCLPCDPALLVDIDDPAALARLA
jgi:CTP:molybdopterin cytidylyltransferase MocA